MVDTGCPELLQRAGTQASQITRPGVRVYSLQTLLRAGQQTSQDAETSACVFLHSTGPKSIQKGINKVLFWDRGEPGSLFLQHCICQPCVLPCNSSLPTQPQQHRHDMELHKRAHLEIVRLITACSPDGRLAPLSPAHLRLQYPVCSSSNP